MPTIARLQIDAEGGPAVHRAPPSPGRRAGWRHAGSHPVPRPRSLERRSARRAPAWSGPRCEKASRSRARAVARQQRSRVRASLVQVTNLGITRQGQPAEHARVRDAARQRRAGRRAPRVSIIDRDNQTVWTGTTDADGVAIAPRTPTLRDAERLVAVLVHRHGREGRRRRLRRQRLERRHPAVGFRRRRSTSAGAAAAARHGVQRPRRLPARRGGALQGHPAAQHREGVRLLPAGTPVMVSRSRQPEPAGRRADASR